LLVVWELIGLLIESLASFYKVKKFIKIRMKMRDEGDL